MKTLQRKINESLGLKNTSQGINESLSGFAVWYEMLANKISNNFNEASKFQNKVDNLFLKDKRFLDNVEYDGFGEDDFYGEDDVESKIVKANNEMTEIYTRNFSNLYGSAIHSILNSDELIEFELDLVKEGVDYEFTLESRTGYEIKIKGDVELIHSRCYGNGKTGEECIRNKYIQSLEQYQMNDMDDDSYFWKDQGAEYVFNVDMAADIFIDILRKDKDWKKLLTMKF